MSAFDSMFALAFAAVAVLLGRRMYAIESERDRVNVEARREQDAFERRAQAALMSAWWGQSRDGRWGVFVRNASEAPVYQVFLTSLGTDDRSEVGKVYALTVPPSERPVFYAVDGDRADARTSARRVKLTFTDAAGVRWLRNQYGLLTELRSELCIKADARRVEALGQFAEDFRATYGVTVALQTSAEDYPQARYVADLQAGPGADAYICPHDWIGELAARDVIEPIVLSADHRSAFPAWALSALTFDGQLYGLPTTVDTVALIRNTELAPLPPTTFEGLIATGAALVDAGRVTDVVALRVGVRGDPFQVWPLFASAGGWLFGRTPDGAWDPAHIGLDAAESIAAFERLRSLGEAGSGILRRSRGRAEAIELFTTGGTAYLISTSDALEAIRDAGIPAAVIAVPPFAGGMPATALTLVHGLVIPRQAPNRTIAHDLFADYLSHAHVMAALSKGTFGPVALDKTMNQDVAIQEYSALCELGAPMPAFPAMNATWRVLEEAEVAIVMGAPAETTARRAAANLRAIFASEFLTSSSAP